MEEYYDGSEAWDEDIIDGDTDDDYDDPDGEEDEESTEDQ